MNFAGQPSGQSRPSAARIASMTASLCTAGPGKDRNVAVAEWDINGTHGEGIAVSDKHVNKEGVGMPINPQFAQTKKAECEWQLLEHIAKDLPRAPLVASTSTPNGSPSPTARM
jgi:hypothetical protein